MEKIPRLGFVITMYNEFETVVETVKFLKNQNCKVVIIQSDPGDGKKIFPKELVDNYDLLPDLAKGQQNYKKISDGFKKGISHSVAARAVTRNFSRGFTIIKDYDIDYAIGLEGDEKISSLEGIFDLIQKIKDMDKPIAGTRTIGYLLHDEGGRLSRFQDIDSTDIMPQFFIARIDTIRKKLFCDIKITNIFTTEQCMGDEILRYAKENNTKFFNIFYSIYDGAYPKNIKGLEYNPNQVSKLPESVERVIIKIRQKNGKRVNLIITKILRLMEKLQI